jgi:hypothetical protein
MKPSNFEFLANLQASEDKHEAKRKMNMTTEVLFSLAKQHELQSRHDDGLNESQSLKKSELSVDKQQK